jgi:hypothetical protein
VLDRIIRRSTGNDEQQLISSQKAARRFQSVPERSGVFRHWVFLIGEGLHVARHILLFRFVELDDSTTNEYEDAILTVLDK